MKSFQKQLLTSIIFFAIIFSLTVYFLFMGVNSLLDKFAEQSAFLLVSHFQPILNAGLNGSSLKNGISEIQEIKLRKQLIREIASLHNVENVLIFNQKGQILFSLNSNVAENNYSVEKLSGSSETQKKIGFVLNKRKGTGSFDAVWPLNTSKKFYGVLTVNSKLGAVRYVLHNLQLKFYLIGFAGLIFVVILSFIGFKSLNSPIKQIEKAMTVIDKRKYGFRLKWKDEDEFAEVYQKVNQALQRLEQLDSVQRKAVHRQNTIQKELKTFSRFLDIMSHEIKNPLHALGINLDVLKTKIEKGQSKESSMKHVDILENEIEHLQEVIQGFLSYVRPGKPQREKVQINAIIKGACQSVTVQAEKSKIRIESRLSRNLRPVLLDKGQFQQALDNIIINAIHATRQGGKINIRSWTKKKKVFVSVKDTGGGISKEHLKNIFDLYYTTKKNGSGLGLPITKRIIEANGGQMQLESKLDRGTKVTFSFTAI